MKVWLIKDELWPYYIIGYDSDFADVSVEISEEKLEWIQRVEKERREVQNFLSDVYHKARPNPPLPKAISSTHNWTRFSIGTKADEVEAYDFPNSSDKGA